MLFSCILSHPTNYYLCRHSAPHFPKPTSIIQYLSSFQNLVLLLRLLKNLMSSSLAFAPPKNCHASKVLRRKKGFCKQPNNKVNLRTENLLSTTPEPLNIISEEIQSINRVPIATTGAKSALHKLEMHIATSAITRKSRRGTKVVDETPNLSLQNFKNTRWILPMPSQSPKRTWLSKSLHTVTRRAKKTLSSSARTRPVKISEPFGFVHNSESQLQTLPISNLFTQKNSSLLLSPKSALSCASQGIKKLPRTRARSAGWCPALSSHPVVTMPQTSTYNTKQETPVILITNPEGETVVASKAPEPGRLRIADGRNLLNPNTGIAFHELYRREKAQRMKLEIKCSSYATKVLELERALISLRDSFDDPIGELVQMHQADTASLRRKLHDAKMDRDAQVTVAANDRIRCEQLEADNIKLHARLAIELGRSDAAVRHKRLEPLLASVVNKNFELQHQVEYFKKESLGQRIEAGNQRKRGDVAEHRIVLLEEKIKRQKREKPSQETGVSEDTVANLEQQLNDPQLNRQLVGLHCTIQELVQAPPKDPLRLKTGQQTSQERFRSTYVDLHELAATTPMYDDNKDLFPLPLSLPHRALAFAPQLPVRSPLRLQPLGQVPPERIASVLQPEQLPTILPSPEIINMPGSTTKESLLRSHAQVRELEVAGAEFDIQKMPLLPSSPTTSTQSAVIPDLDNSSSDYDEAGETLTDVKFIRVGSKTVHTTKSRQKLGSSSPKIEGGGSGVGETRGQLDSWFWGSVPDLELCDPREGWGKD